MSVQHHLTLLLTAAVLFAASCSKKQEPSGAANRPPAEVSAPDPNLPARIDKDAIPLAEVEKMAKVIEADANWFQSIKDKAAERNVPLNIQLTDDARFFLYEHQAEYGIVSIPQEVVEAEIAKIKAAPEWLESIRKQAQEKGMPLEEALRKNALFVLDQRMR